MGNQTGQSPLEEFNRKNQQPRQAQSFDVAGTQGQTGGTVFAPEIQQQQQAPIQNTFNATQPVQAPIPQPQPQQIQQAPQQQVPMRRRGTRKGLFSDFSQLSGLGGAFV